MDGLDVMILRRRSGLKQWQLAQKLNVSQTILSEIECHKRPINRELIEKIKDIFGVRDLARVRGGDTKAGGESFGGIHGQNRVG